VRSVLALVAVGTVALVSSGAQASRANGARGSEVLLFSAGKPAKLRLADPEGRVRIVQAGRGPQLTPDWSPDGRRIAFSAHGELAIVDPAGGIPRRLTHSAAVDFRPVWSPDGRRLAFFSQGPQESVTLVRDDVMVIGTDGRGARRLVRAPVQHPFLSWSNDGAWLVFAKAGFGAPQLVLVDTRTSESRLLSQGRDPAFSPDGARIAFVRGTDNAHQLAVARPDDGSTQVLYETTARLSEPAWSPDGRSVVVVVSDRNKRSQLEVVDVESSKHRILTRASSNADTSPTWSPDGDRIAFVRYTPRMPLAEGVLMTIRPSGTGLQVVPHSHLTDRFAAFPQWRP
jgi:TolB protein